MLSDQLLSCCVSPSAAVASESLGFSTGLIGVGALWMGIVIRFFEKLCQGYAVKGFDFDSDIHLMNPTFYSYIA